MGHIIKTPAGTFRANWRDPSGTQRAKTFPTRKEASAFLAEMEGSKNRGTYVNPHAGRVRFEDFAARWLLTRDVEARTAERTLSLLRTHLIPRWGRWQLGQIDYLSVQEWVTDLRRYLAPATVAKCHGLLLMILKTAVRAKVIAVNPAEGVRLPLSPDQQQRRAASLSLDDFRKRLLPAVPVEYRALVAIAAGAGLRWGECAGLPWHAVDLRGDRVEVAQVAVETPGSVSIRPYPKTRAGRRLVPMAPFLVAELRVLLSQFDREPSPQELVFDSRVGTPLRRSNFRRRVWVPALTRAELPSTLRFHDLRHSYATWLVTNGVPVNAVQKVMGHANASTTLNRYTHAPFDYEDRVRTALIDAADDSLTFDHQDGPDDDDGPNAPALIPA